MSIEAFKNVGKKFDAFVSETKTFICEKILKKKPPQNTQRVSTSIIPQKMYTGYTQSTPSYAKSARYERLIREKIALFQKEYANEASEDLIDRLAKVFNSSNFRANPWLYIDRWKEQKEHKHFSEKEQPLALDFFENKLLKGMSPINLAPLDTDRGLGVFSSSIRELFENASFRENPLLFTRTLEKQNKESDQKILKTIKEKLCIESIKLDMEYLQKKAANYKLDDESHPQMDTIAVLANKLFRKNPALFMENWIKQRGLGENHWGGEDHAKFFFQRHLKVISIPIGELLNEIQKEPKELRTDLKKILYNPAFQRHPLQFLELLGKEPVSEVQNTQKTWFLSKFDPDSIETKETVTA